MTKSDFSKDKKIEKTKKTKKSAYKDRMKQTLNKKEDEDSDMEDDDQNGGGSLNLNVNDLRHRGYDNKGADPPKDKADEGNHHAQTQHGPSPFVKDNDDCKEGSISVHLHSKGSFHINV